MSWCCRPCRCGTIVHAEDGRDPANACLHGDAICGHCAPGDCDECQAEDQEPIDLLAVFEQVVTRHRAERPAPKIRPVEIAGDTFVEPLYVQRRRTALEDGGAA